MSERRLCPWQRQARNVGESEIERKLTMVRWAYDEVLDATKHQDDKIGRFLTAIAFLTTATIALFFRADLLAYRWTFGVAIGGGLGHGDYPLIAWFSAAFFAFVLTSVWLLLSSLSAPLRAPGIQARYGPQIGRSRLFFTHIARERGDAWECRWKNKTTSEIEEEIFGHFVNETHNIAERADGKYTQTRKGAGLFGIGLSYLALALTLAVFAVVSGSAPAEFSVQLRLAVGLILGGHAWLQVNTVAVGQMASTQLQEDAQAKVGSAPIRWAGARSLRRIGWLFVIYAWALLLPGDDTRQKILGAACAAVVTGGALVMSCPRWRPEKTRLGVVERIVEFGLVPVLLAAGVLVLGGTFPLGLAACLPLALGWLLNTRDVPRLLGAKGHDGKR